MGRVRRSPRRRYAGGTGSRTCSRSASPPGRHGSPDSTPAIGRRATTLSAAAGRIAPTSAPRTRRTQAEQGRRLPPGWAAARRSRSVPDPYTRPHVLTPASRTPRRDLLTIDAPGSRSGRSIRRRDTERRMAGLATGPRRGPEMTKDPEAPRAASARVPVVGGERVESNRLLATPGGGWHRAPNGPPTSAARQANADRAKTRWMCGRRARAAASGHNGRSRAGTSRAATMRETVLPRRAFGGSR